MSARVTRPENYDGLMERMAAALGVEVLRDAEALGLQTGDIERLMRRCAACSEPRLCRGALAKPGAALPPDYCMNRKLLLFLAAKSKRGQETGPG